MFPLQLLEQLAARLRLEATTAASAIATFTNSVLTSTIAVTSDCETSRLKDIITASAFSAYQILQNSLGDADAALNRRSAEFNATFADLRAANASFIKEKTYLDSFKTCGVTAAAAWSGSTGSALFLADYYFSYYDWNNGHSPRLGNFFQNAFASMTASDKDALVVTSLKADRDSWTLDDNTQVGSICFSCNLLVLHWCV